MGTKDPGGAGWRGGVGRLSQLSNPGRGHDTVWGREVEWVGIWGAREVCGVGGRAVEGVAATSCKKVSEFP